ILLTPIVWCCTTCRKRRRRAGRDVMNRLKNFLPQRRKDAKEDAKKASWSPAGFAPLRLCGKLVLCAVLLCSPIGVNAQTPQATPPPPAPPRSGTFPKPVEQTLPNGLRLIVVERHENPLVSAQ